MINLMPYIGGKHRIARQIAGFLHAPGIDMIVDVFGGSGAILLNSGFQKRVYNDADGDLVNLMRVIADDTQRPRLLKMIRTAPCSRKIFEDFSREYVSNNFSFGDVADPVDRAFRFFYRIQFAFGGKARSGGFALSCSDRPEIKELQRYRNGIKRIASLASFFRETAIECLDYQACISTYGKYPNAVLFVDPPYYGKENYYSHRFSRWDHTFLADLLLNVKARPVCSYYDTPEIRELYPEERWEWAPIQNMKNSQRRGCQKEKAIDWILTRRTS